MKKHGFRPFLVFASNLLLFFLKEAEDMFEGRTFITEKEIGEVLGVSESKSYGIVRDLNKELADKGYMVIPGRVSRKYFEERFYGVENETEENEEKILPYYKDLVMRDITPRDGRRVAIAMEESRSESS